MLTCPTAIAGLRSWVPQRPRMHVHRLDRPRACRMPAKGASPDYRPLGCVCAQRSDFFFLGSCKLQGALRPPALFFDFVWDSWAGPATTWLLLPRMTQDLSLNRRRSCSICHSEFRIEDRAVRCAPPCGRALCSRPAAARLSSQPAFQAHRHPFPAGSRTSGESCWRSSTSEST